MPIPASPTITTTWPCPRPAAAHACRMRAISVSRPISRPSRAGASGAAPRRVSVHAPRRRWGVAGGAARRRLLQQLAIEVLRLRLRLRPQLALQHADAHLVLPQRLAPPALARVQPHQRPMHRLLHGVQREQPRRRVHRALGLARLALEGEQSGQDLERELAQTRPLGAQPVLERLLRDADALEQVALVQRDGLLEGLRGAAGREALELLHVHLDGGRVEGQGVVIHDENRRLGRGQRPAQGDEGLTEALPGLLVAGVAPEQARQLVARMRPARRHRRDTQ